jgi:hypothetical protein
LDFARFSRKDSRIPVKRNSRHLGLLCTTSAQTFHPLKISCVFSRQQTS